VSRGEVLPRHFLAMNPSGMEAHGIEGIPTQEPCFGLKALWVTEQEKDRAKVEGFTVVDVPSVIATHLTETIRSHAAELIGRQEVQHLLDRFAKDNPKVVEELVPNLLPLGSVVKVLGSLLRERVAIRDLRTILETLADIAPMSKETGLLTEYCRQALSRTITKQYEDPDGKLYVISVNPRLDRMMSEAIQKDEQGGSLTLDPILVRRASEAVAMKGHHPVLMCSPMLRLHLRKMAERFIPNLVVLSSEIATQAQLQSIETVDVIHEN